APKAGALPSCATARRHQGNRFEESVPDVRYVADMGIPPEIQERIERWERPSRREKSEVGRDLRRLGLSYGEIQRLIDVKKSTLATWCRDIELTPEQYAEIRRRTGTRAGIPRDTNRKRRLEIEAIREQARRSASTLLSDTFWVAGTILYWAEGAKTRNHLALNNTDPRALRLFITWVRTYLQPDAAFSLQLHLHEGNDEETAKEHWRNQTGLHDANFHKTFIKPAGTGHRNNRLEHGVCTVRVRRAAD